MGSLSNLYISQSYQSLIHLSTDTSATTSPTQLEDGVGTSLGIYVNTNGEVSASSFSGSINGIGNVSAFSTSVDSRLDIITASFLTTASFNTFSTSVDSRLDAEEFKSTTFATTGSNTFVGNQTINGNVNITGSLTASGLIYPTTDNGVKSFIQTDGNGNLSLQYVDAIFETVRNMSGVPLDKGTPVYISGSTGDNGNAYVADASDSAKMPAIYILGEDLAAGATGIALVGGLIEGVNTTGYPAGTIIYVAEGGGWTSSRPSGSSSIVQVLGVVQKEGSGGQGVVINQLEATLPNIQTGYVWVGNGSNQPVAVATSSFIEDLSGYTTTASFNAFTQSISSSVDSISSSVGLLQTFSGSEYKADSSSFDSRINGIVVGSGYATTGSNTFNGNQIINGTLSVSSSTSVDVNVVGRIAVTGPTSGQIPILYVSSSDATTTLGRFSNVVSNTTHGTAFTYTTNFGSYVQLYDVAGTKAFGFTLSGSAFSLPNWSGPAIYGQSDALGTTTGFIGFEDGTNYTDGRVTVLKPLSASAGIIDARISGSLEITGGIAGNITEVTVASSTASIDFSKGSLQIQITIIDQNGNNVDLKNLQYLSYNGGV